MKHRRNVFRIFVTSIFMTIVGAVLSGFFVVAAIASDTTPTKFIAPQLNVPIPGLDFTKYPVTIVGETATIPFLSEYILAVYNYIIAVAVIAAAVMIVYGGFKYIISSGGAQFSNGKDVIRDAIIGLLLILGTYTILQAINPATLSLSGIQVLVIRRIPFETEERTLERTGAETGVTPYIGAPSSVAIPEATTTPAAPGIPQAPPPPAVPAFTECPVTLTNPLTLLTEGKDAGKSYLAIAKDPRTQEFFQKIKPLITGATFDERLSQAANAALKCNVHLGTCANTAANIWALAGAIDPACLTGVCTVSTIGKNANVKSIRGLPTSVSLKIINLRCTTEKPCESNPSCVNDGPAAAAQVRSMLQQMPDYPDGWLNDLQPGDYIQVYNGNPSCGGQHSALFVGWAGDGKANLVQGPGWGKNPNARTVCLKPSCGIWNPITAIVRSKQL